MAFPSTGVLDAFTGSDEDPIASGWAGPIWPGEGQFRRASSQLRFPSGGGDAGSYWDVEQFAADQEVYVAIPVTTNVDVHRLGLVARLTNPNTATWSAYVLFLWSNAGTWVLKLFEYTDLVSTQIGSDMALTWTNGDRLGLSCTGTTLTVYHYTGGAWVEVDSHTDATHTGAGYIGLLGYMTDDAIIDDFGGGEFALGQILLPDADITTTGWSTAPLFSKVNDESDATFITSTAA